MKARQLIEAEDPKSALAKGHQHRVQKSQYYRFGLANGTFCFSVVATDEAQAVQRAQAWIQAYTGESWDLWDDEFLNPVCHAPSDEQVTEADILDVSELSEVFRCSPEEAIAKWEQRFKEAVGA